MPATLTVPLVGSSKPQIKLSNEDLPEPEGPMTATRSPCSTLRSISRRACTTLPSPWFLQTCSSWMVLWVMGAPFVEEAAHNQRWRERSLCFLRSPVRLFLAPLRQGASLRVEPRPLHPAPHRIILHELLPHETRPSILCHQQRDPQVDPQHVRVVPVLQWIECVDEPISPPRLLPELFPDPPQHPNRLPGKERQRATRRARHDAPVDQTHRRRSSPCLVAMHRIRGGDAPQIFAVIGKLLRQLDAPEFVDFRRDHRIQKVIRVLVALAAEVKPRV